jgi:hypothetical protein
MSKNTFINVSCPRFTLAIPAPTLKYVSGFLHCTEKGEWFTFNNAQSDLLRQLPGAFIIKH